MKVIYRNQDYLLVDESFTKSEFKHNFLLFVNDTHKRLVYSVQMAVNYISTLPHAAFNETIDEQYFVACLPITEYPEILDYLQNKSNSLTTSQLADKEATRLIELVTQLLNDNKSVNEANFLDRLYKLTQHKRLLEIENTESPQSIYSFEELYHIYLNKQRLFKTSFQHQMEFRRLSSSLKYFTRIPQLSAEEFSEFKILLNKFKDFQLEIKKYNYSWYSTVSDEIDKY